MQITAQMVKELRERSGAGMMECKKALTQNDGNLETAIEWLRKQGLSKADKKAGRVTAEGCIALAQADSSAVLVEVNSETDFIAKDENFVAFTNAVAKGALEHHITAIDTLKTTAVSPSSTVEEARQTLVAKCGENIQVRRLLRMDAQATLATYVHGNRIGVLVDVRNAPEELAKGIAMHIAAMTPQYLSADQVPAEIVQKEKEIALAQIQGSGKPPEIMEKIVQGKVHKILAEMCLTGQSYALDNQITVEQALQQAGAEVLDFKRLAVGEGIEKKEDDFASEVMKQAGLA